MAEEAGARAVARITRTIELIAERGGARIDDIATDLQIHKSSASRLLAALRAVSWLDANVDRTWFTLGPRLITVGRAALPDSRLDAATQLAKEVRDHLDETVHLALLDRRSWTTTVVAALESRRPLRVALPIGARDPLHATAGGKVLLATLDDATLDRVLDEIHLDLQGPNTVTSVVDLRNQVEQARRDGFATNVEESRAGLVAGAVVLGEQSDPATHIALSIAAPASRLPAAVLVEHMSEIVRQNAHILALPHARAPH